MTQPEWWLLHQISLHPGGVARNATVEKIGHNDTPRAIVDAIESAMSKGWISASTSMLTFTIAGAEQFTRAETLQRELQTERMQGITEDEFATTILVLQRTIENVGGDAWHW